MSLPVDLSRFRPLKTVLCYDDFDKGMNGWVDLTPNFRLPAYKPVEGPVLLTRWGPTMLSTASFPLVGTHGSMNGIYSLKLTTRPIAGRFEDPPAAGSMGQALKRLTFPGEFRFAQFEMWYAFKSENDRPGFCDSDVRAIGILWDFQDDAHRFMPAVRYVNSINGQLKQHWYYSRAADGISNRDWEYGNEGWHKVGIDPQWYGRRYEDGHTDGFQPIPGGAQRLCYNESDDKINWLYLRFLFDMEKREYVELQSCKKTFDLRGIQPTLAPTYANIDDLLNASLWVETDTERRAFLFADSIVISLE